MDLLPPSGLRPFEVLFDSSEVAGALPPGLVRFVGNLGFPAPPPDRPWIFANFAQTIDGLVSFGGKRPGGEWISRSIHDRWMMDLLRAHADAVILGARSLELETLYGSIPGGPVFRIVDPELLRLRHEVLGRKKLKNIIVSGSCKMNPSSFRLFHSEYVESWIATTPEGRERLGSGGQVQTIVSGSGHQVDLKELVRKLHSELGIEYLLCEGGPTLYGSFQRQAWIDEKFVTIAPQEIGVQSPPGESSGSLEAESRSTPRPTSFAGPGFRIENARWYRWISSRKAGDHEFNRYRVLPTAT